MYSENFEITGFCPEAHNSNLDEDDLKNFLEETKKHIGSKCLLNHIYNNRKAGTSLIWPGLINFLCCIALAASIFLGPKLTNYICCGPDIIACIPSRIQLFIRTQVAQLKFNTVRWTWLHLRGIFAVPRDGVLERAVSEVRLGQERQRHLDDLRDLQQAVP